MKKNMEAQLALTGELLQERHKEGDDELWAVVLLQQAAPGLLHLRQEPQHSVNCMVSTELAVNISCSCATALL